MCGNTAPSTSRVGGREEVEEEKEEEERKVDSSAQVPLLPPLEADIAMGSTFPKMKQSADALELQGAIEHRRSCMREGSPYNTGYILMVGGGG
ncbi:unnamed protein product [Taenia asiatica]|uniref:N6-L-threonylcarbamoyladenine synthase n=1 Tax=Taenia asiatica TaxID=60517 RepID=A0A0R3WFS0_TAEAS|nr:unnamed protein product [Taenia asiatica]